MSASRPRYPRPIRSAVGAVKRVLLSSPAARRILSRTVPPLVRRRSQGPTAADYAAWVERYDTLTAADIRRRKEVSATLSCRPLISIVLPVYDTPVDDLSLTVQSVFSQIYDRWELCIADDCSSNPAIRTYLSQLPGEDSRIKVTFREARGHISAASNSALALATGEYVAFLDHDDLLAADALSHVVSVVNADPGLDLIYSDEDKIDTAGVRFEPHFKSGWNPDLLYGQNYVCHLLVCRTAVVRELGGFREGYDGSQDYDLVLRLAERTPPDRIRHLPRVLYHWRASRASTAHSPNAKRYAVDASRNALRDHLQRVGAQAEVLPVPNCQHHRVRWATDDHTLVSVIVPTRDRCRLLKRCLDGVLRKTSYGNVEVIVIDNESTEPDTQKYLQRIQRDLRVRVVRRGGPFNFSALNNAATRLARGDFLLFLNNDIEVCDSGWLTEMVSQLHQDGVGIVGARLLYPDDTVQHAGIVIGIGGVAGHLYKGWHRSDLGYKGRAQLTQNVSAVTAACMLVRKTVFDQVGGFDAANLGVAFNDVDLCLKVCELGRRIVWTPYATLIHHESQSRGSDRVGANLERFREEHAFMVRKWRTPEYNDPYFNPNLSLDQTGIALAEPPRVRTRVELERQHVA